MRAGSASQEIATFGPTDAWVYTPKGKEAAAECCSGVFLGQGVGGGKRPWLRCSLYFMGEVTMPFIPRLLSTFQIRLTDDRPKGFLVPCSAEQDRGCPAGHLTDSTNEMGRYYEENHLEEWVARCPASLFPNEDVAVIASQNYAFLPEKIDLLFAVRNHGFSVVEAKVQKVAMNGGVVPYSICQQMSRYVRFLTDYLADYPRSHESYFTRFSKKFYGSCRAVPDISPFAPNGGLRLHEVYLAEGYDNYALDYFDQHLATNQPRLTYYQYYPSEKVIEFWEFIPE